MCSTFDTATEINDSDTQPNDISLRPALPPSRNYLTDYSHDKGYFCFSLNVTPFYQQIEQNSEIDEPKTSFSSNFENWNDDP